ncbi:MAG: Tex family protein [Spirochaetales bacterium]
MTTLQYTANSTGLSTSQVGAVLELLSQGHTVPFLARYRKEATGNCDEVQIAAVEEASLRFEALEKRRQTILLSLKEQGLWTAALEASLLVAPNLATLEDLYLPYRPKRKTRASQAREAGFGELADWLWTKGTLQPAKVWTAEAYSGANDILAERLSETPLVRSALRDLCRREGVLRVRQPRGHKGENPFSDHLERNELLRLIPGYRLLALLRGVAEDHLKLEVEIDPALALEVLERSAGLTSTVREAVRMAARDAWKRLIHPSLEAEVLTEARERAELQALEVFAGNLQSVLLAPPLGQKRVLAVDPGFRTGCKVVVLSAQGDLLEYGVISPLEPHNRSAEAETRVRAWVSKHKVEAVAIGNGTAGSESFEFFRSMALGVPLYSVAESGASVYSASAVAREEFPDLDLTVRGAVSIGRRLLDPLAELVKVDPKSIGVGQYQHDVNQNELKRHLDRVVVSCVNRVGVDVNTATFSLLRYVAGFSTKLAGQVVEHRRKKGPFRSRQEFRQVTGFGDKTFEQSAGFLRISGGTNCLDGTAVHPESYSVVEKIALALGESVDALVGAPNLRERVGPLKLPAGPATLADILAELERPGRDPRAASARANHSLEARTMADLKEGDVLEGVVTNVTDFGAFVDIGVHQDGLVHISQLADRFVNRPLDVVQPGLRVSVRVLSVDLTKKRISLSRKGLEK